MTKTDQTNTAIVLASLEKQARPIAKKLSKLTSINTQEDFNNAGQLTKELKGLGAIAEKEMKGMIDPLNVTIKKIREHFRPFSTMIANNEAHIKTMMLDFVSKQKKLSAKVDQDFEAGKIKKVGTYADKKMSAEIVNGAAKVRKVWTVIIDDEEQIPKDYMVPDMKLIEIAFKQGNKVKGCRYEQVEQIAI